MAFFKVTACLLLAATALGAPQSLVNNFDFNPTGLSEAELAAQMFDPNPQYTYQYQVAADPQQTYIAHQESRDGENVDGEYSYVDPLGNLITVTYTAGAMGYTETRNVQENFVKIRGLPAVEQVVSNVVSSSGSRDSDLVGSIISQLTPFIKNTVSTSLGGSSSSSGLGSARTVVSAPATSASRFSSIPSSTASRPLSASRFSSISSAPASSRTILSSAPVRSTSISSFPASTSSRTISSIAAAPVTSTRTLVSSAPVRSSSAVSSIFGTGGNNNVAFSSKDFDFTYDLEA